MNGSAPNFPTKPNNGEIDWGKTIEEEIKKQLAEQAQEVKKDSEQLLEKEKPLQEQLNPTPTSEQAKAPSVEPQQKPSDQNQVAAISSAPEKLLESRPSVAETPKETVEENKANQPTETISAENRTEIPIIKPEPVSPEPAKEIEVQPAIPAAEKVAASSTAETQSEKAEAKPPEVKEAQPQETQKEAENVGEKVIDTTITPEEVNLPADPLQASLEFAFKDLKIGSRIGENWTLKKIITTNFGNNKSSFYELQNKEGVNWTLNQEEVKDLIKKTLQGKDSDQGPKELPNLSPIKIVKTVEPPFVSEKKESKLTKLIPKLNLSKEPSQPEPKPEVKETSETKTSPETSGLNLNPEQIELIKTIHQNQKQWKTFTSLAAAQWEKISELYEKGRLSEIGVDAHPLTDYLSNPNIGSLIEVKKGDTFVEILKRNNYSLNWTKEDAPVLGVHLIANRKLLETAHLKAENQGISLKPFPSDKEVIATVISAQTGSTESLSLLYESLSFVPFNQRIKVLSKDEVEKLKKYFQI